MIRILHVLSSIGKTAGVPNSIMNYYRNMDRNKVQFDFVVFKKGSPSFENEIALLGGRVFYLMQPNLKGLPAFIKELDSVLKVNAQKYKAIQLHDLYLNLIVSWLARKYGIANLIAHSHTTMYSDKLFSKIRNFILFQTAKGTFPIHFGCSRAAGEFMFGKKALDGGRVRIIQNAIDTRKFRYNLSLRENVRASLGVGDSFVVGHTGMFIPVKNHLFILEVFREILKIRENSVLLLIGEGELFEDIKKKAEDMGIGQKVLFLGTRGDVDKLYQAMDAFIMPSLHEGLPLSALEAQAAGLRCVLSETISKEAAVYNVKQLSLTQDACYWADSIVGYCTDYDREDCLDKIRSSGFDISTEAARLQDIYLAL
jgi:glycosyltransferase involved in cell wall biosynthesis